MNARSSSGPTAGRRLLLTLAGVALAWALLAGGNVWAALLPGTTGNDVFFGLDNDNASNSFIQPTAVPAKQHLANTDALIGSSGDDLLIGMGGSDLLDGDAGNDILIGGVEGFVAPNSDVLRGGVGNDINIWAPGDGSDAFVGGSGTDAQLFAPIVLDNGRPALFSGGYSWNRQIPHVEIASKPQFSCTLEAVPASQNLGFDYLVRFFANGNLAVTVRLREVEQLFCPSANAGKVNYADLTAYSPAFVERPLSDFSGTLVGAIMQAP